MHLWVRARLIRQRRRDPSVLWQVWPWGGFDFSSWFWLLSSSSWLLLLSGGCVGPWEFLPGGIYLHFFVKKWPSLCIHGWEGSTSQCGVWGVRQASPGRQMVLAVGWCSHISLCNQLWCSHGFCPGGTRDLWLLPNSVLREQTWSWLKLQMLLTASNPPWAAETQGGCSLLPEMVSGKQRRGLCWLFRP